MAGTVINAALTAENRRLDLLVRTLQKDLNDAVALLRAHAITAPTSGGGHRGADVSPRLAERLLLDHHHHDSRKGIAHDKHSRALDSLSSHSRATNRSSRTTGNAKTPRSTRHAPTGGSSRHSSSSRKDGTAAARSGGGVVMAAPMPLLPAIGSADPVRISPRYLQASTSGSSAGAAGAAGSLLHSPRGDSSNNNKGGGVTFQDDQLRALRSTKDYLRVQVDGTPFSTPAPTPATTTGSTYATSTRSSMSIMSPLPSSRNAEIELKEREAEEAELRKRALQEARRLGLPALPASKSPSPTPSSGGGGGETQQQQQQRPQQAPKTGEKGNGPKGTSKTTAVEKKKKKQLKKNASSSTSKEQGASAKQLKSGSLKPSLMRQKSTGRNKEAAAATATKGSSAAVGSAATTTTGISRKHGEGGSTTADARQVAVGTTKPKKLRKSKDSSEAIPPHQMSKHMVSSILPRNASSSLVADWKRRFPIGRAVIANGYHGHVKYIGFAPFGDGVWFGLELDLGFLLPHPVVDYAEDEGVDSDVTTTNLKKKKSDQALYAPFWRNTPRGPGMTATSFRIGSVHDRVVAQSSDSSSTSSQRASGHQRRISVSMSNVRSSKQHELRLVVLRDFKSMAQVAPNRSYFCRGSVIRAVRVSKSRRYSATERVFATSPSYRPFSKIDAEAVLLRPWIKRDDRGTTLTQVFAKQINTMFSTAPSDDGIADDNVGGESGTPKHAVRKLRVLFRWIAEHIKFDPSNSQNIDMCDTNMVLKRRCGDANGMARLFAAVSRILGFDCIVIRGWSKLGSSYTPGGSFTDESSARHHWNAIRIDIASDDPDHNYVSLEGGWALVDCCWSSVTRGVPGASSSNAGTGAKKPRRLSGGGYEQVFSDAFFMPNPKLFSLSHFPRSVVDGRALFLHDLGGFASRLQFRSPAIDQDIFEQSFAPGRAVADFGLHVTPNSYKVNLQGSVFFVDITSDIRERLEYRATMAFIRALQDNSGSSGAGAVPKERKDDSEPGSLITDFNVDNCVHIQYPDAHVTRVVFMFPVPGKFACHVYAKSGMSEVAKFDRVADYRVRAPVGMVPYLLKSGDGQKGFSIMTGGVSSSAAGGGLRERLVLGFLSREIGHGRDHRREFASRFVLLEPTSGFFIADQPFDIHIAGPREADNVVVVINGAWKRLERSETADGHCLFAGQVVIRAHAEIKVYYEVENSHHRLFVFRPAEKDDARMRRMSRFVSERAYAHGRILLDSYGRCFDSELEIDVDSIRLSQEQCMMTLFAAMNVEVTAMLKDGWKTGQSSPESIRVERGDRLRTRRFWTIVASLGNVRNAEFSILVHVHNSEDRGAHGRFALSYHFDCEQARVAGAGIKCWLR